MAGWCVAVSMAGLTLNLRAVEPLHARIDALIAAAHPGGQAPIAGDADFLRRTYLALHGVIPTAAQARAFLADTAPDKRAKLVELLLADPQFAKWMAVRFDVMLMERRGEAQTKAGPWLEWLEQSFAANKPWDALVREVIAADGADEKTRHVARWLLEREVDPNALAKDAARLFLGRDIACSQCHDHPRIDDYLQRDYAGLQAFFSRSYLFKGDAKKAGPSSLVGEQADGDTTYLSVFTKVGGGTKPRLPGEGELAEPATAEWTVPPDAKNKALRPIPKFSRRGLLATALGDGHHPAFRRNIANRLWAVVFGRGLVEPLDLHHSANPPAIPPLLDLLGDQIAAMKFDMRAFVRELALTQAFQRALDLPDPSADVAGVARKLAELEKTAEALALAAHAAEERFIAEQKATADAQRAAAPVLAEQAKLDAAAAAAKKPLDAALAEQKKADDALAAKREEHRALADSAAISDEAAVTAGETPELAAAKKAFQKKALAMAAALAAAETDAAKKKAAVDALAKTIETARQATLATKTKSDAATAQIAIRQKALDEAGARKESDRIRAKHAAQLVAEAKAVIAWSKAGNAAPAEREAVSSAWGHTFASMELLPLAPAQLCWSLMQATGQLEPLRNSSTAEWDAKHKLSDADKANPAKQAERTAGMDRLFREKLRGQETQFVKFFGGAAGQPQTDFFATPEQALYFENGGVIRQWAASLATRTAPLPDVKAMAEEIYLATLTRLPDAAEVAELAATLAARPPEKKAEALGDFAWALLASLEFRFVH
jgi:hypothetical protein